MTKKSIPLRHGPSKTLTRAMLTLEQSFTYRQVARQQVVQLELVQLELVQEQREQRLELQGRLGPREPQQPELRARLGPRGPLAQPEPRGPLERQSLQEP